MDEDGLTFLSPKVWFNWIGLSARRGKLALKFWKTDSENLECQPGSSSSSDSSKPIVDDVVAKTHKVETHSNFPVLAKETLKLAIIHFGKKWHRRFSFIWRMQCKWYGVSTSCGWDYRIKLITGAEFCIFLFPFSVSISQSLH